MIETHGLAIDRDAGAEADALRQIVLMQEIGQSASSGPYSRSASRWCGVRRG
jgi:hypothetical protein